MLFVFEGCHDFIRTVPALCADSLNPNDVQKGGEDHVGDETRYMCMSRPYKHDEPKKIRDFQDVQPLRYCDLKEIKIERQRWI